MEISVVIWVYDSERVKYKTMWTQNQFDVTESYNQTLHLYEQMNNFYFLPVNNHKIITRTKKTKRLSGHYKLEIFLVVFVLYFLKILISSMSGWENTSFVNYG